MGFSTSFVSFVGQFRTRDLRGKNIKTSKYSIEYLFSPTIDSKPP